MSAKLSAVVAFVVIAHLLVTAAQNNASICEEHHITDDVSVRNCCKIPKLVGETSAFQCRHLTDRGQKAVAVKVWQQPDPCLIECLFKVIGVIENGRLNREGLRHKFVENAHHDQELVTSINASIDGCVDADGLVLDTAKPANMTRQECDENSALVFSCVYRQILLRCPEHMVVDSEPCIKYRIFTTECPTPAFVS